MSEEVLGYLERQGGFKQGRKHGHGRMFWAHNGETYEGDWYHDSRYRVTLLSLSSVLPVLSSRSLSPGEQAWPRCAYVHGRSVVQGVLLQKRSARFGTSSPQVHH